MEDGEEWGRMGWFPLSLVNIIHMILSNGINGG